MNAINFKTGTGAGDDTAAGAAPTVRQMKILAEGLSFPEKPGFAADGTLWAVELKRGGAGVERW